VPVFALAAALAFCLVQNRLSPGALSQSKRTGLFFTIFTMGLSLYFSLVTPAGVGLYWSLGNLAAIGVVLILNLLYNPKKLATEALAYINANRKTSQQLKEEKHTKKALAARERQDAARFAAADKKLVFYALTGGQFRYYKNIIDYILENSDITIHYLTNDPNDSVFQHKNKRIVPYYAGHRKTVFLMLNLDTDIFVTTVPDLQTFHMKRSVARENIEYIFVPHTVGSVHVTLKEAACDHFDTVFCVGPHQAAEVRRREEYANLSKKKLIKAGYGLYDTLAQSYKELTANKNEEPDSPKKILIAPSWQPDNVLDLCIEDILTSLQGQGFEIIVRPHPQYVSLFPERMKALQERYSQYDDITFGLDISDNVSVFSADILITDWSNISYEFAYCTLKPCIFINTPMKIMNPNYERLGLENVDVSIRDKIGISVDVDNVRRLHKIADDLLDDQAGYRERITQVMEQYLYYPMRNGEAGGRYIIQNIQKV
jgi:YidC/Oxa1 family membrane protein insertase